MDIQFSDLVVEYGKTRVLHKVHGNAICGQTLAIIGHSGAGKTTLLNALAGRIELHCGSILFGNQKANKQLRRQIAYVTQEDVFFPNITLKETLMFNALLRLPDNTSYKEKCQRVEDMVEQFDLTQCINTKMGGVISRGLSGGERKRANIVCEMMNNADIIIADEPTSGLDSATACKVMTLLQNYAKTEKKTAIITLHQPSSSIVHLCADIMVLSSGKVAYNGPVNGITEFLSANGFECPAYYNPADFILEKLKESEEFEDKMVQASLLTRSHDCKRLNESPDNSVQGQVNGAFVADGTVTIEISVPEAVEHAQWKTGFWTQYRMLCRRQIKQTARSILSIQAVIAFIIMALFTGFLWFQLPHTDDKISDRMGLILFIQLYFGFGVYATAQNSFQHEKAIIKHEQAAGMYRLSAYYLSKMTSEIVVNSLTPFLFNTFVFWMAGLSPKPWIFICILLILEAGIITAAGIGIFFSILIDDFQTSFIVANNFYVGMMILGGFFVVNETKWFQWTEYLSSLYWSSSAIYKLEFLYGTGLRSDQRYSNLTSHCETVAEALESRLRASGPVWLDCVIVLFYLIFFWLAGYVILRVKKKWKSNI